MRRRAYRRPYRTRKRKGLLKSRLFWLLVLILVLVAASSYYTLFSPALQLNKITVFGNEKISEEEIENLIREEVKKDLVSLKSQSIVFADPARIAKALLKKYPLIETAEAKRVLPTGFEVAIKERMPVAIWCAEENCFLIDRKGVIFEKSASQGKLIIKDWENQPVRLGQTAIDEETMAAILEIYNQLALLEKIEIQEIVLPGNSRITVKTKEGWEAYFSLKKDVSWQVTKLKLVLEKQIPLEKRKELEYIELRFGNLAPYRYR